MRYILIILVFLSVGAKSQMVIKAHANYRPLVQPAANLLLDDYPNAAAAYSLRKLDKDYTGNAIRVRRDDFLQTEQDFGFTASGYLDTSAIRTFCGSNTGYIAVWYDQSGNARNISQSVASRQPIFYDGPSSAFASLTATRSDVRKSPFFDNNLSSRLINNFSTISQPITTFSVSRIDNATTGGFDIIYDSYNNTTFALGYTGLTESPNNRWLISSGTGLTGTTAGNTSPNIYTALHNSTSSSIHINGQSYVSGNSGTNGLNGLSVGNLRGNPNPIASGYGLDGRIAELIIYGSNQSTNRTAIENNINDYYNIYWNGDFTGILDTYPNSAAAYSLRNLSSTYTGPLIRVRKDTTGQPEMDIYGDYYGNLDTVGLKNFLLTRSGFVTTWYDQSGNGRNASQATQANQPRIALNGVIDRKNGKPMINYDGSNDRLAIPSSTSTFNFLHNGTKSFISTVAHVNNSSVEYVLLENINANPYYTGTYIATFGTFRFAQQNTIGVFPSSFGFSVSNLSGNNVISTNQFLATINIDADNATAADRSEVFINNGNAIKNNTQTGAINSLSAPSNLTFGSSADGAYGFLNGGFQEILIYGSDQSSNRTGIRDNINTHYGIY